jgi:hypothetical protein
VSRFSSIVNQAQLQRGDTPPLEIIPGDETALSDSEQQALDHYERVIERGLKTFVEVGAALAHVRDLRLYRVDYPTFEAYCDDRWGLARNRAYQLIDAAGVAQNVQNFGQNAPNIESHAAALARLKDPDQQRQAWAVALQRAKEMGKRITAALVEAVVREVQPTEPPDEPVIKPPQKGQSAAHSEAEDTEPEADIDPTHETPQNPAQWLTENVTLDADDDALDDEEDAEQRGEWPDDLEDMQATLHRRGYVLVKETEARLTYQRDSDQAVVTVAKPPEPGKLKVRVVAHRDDDWQDVADHLALAGVELDSPRSGHLPKYPETQRAYGVLDLNADQLDQVAQMQREVEQWKHRHETQRQALEAMRGRAIQAETQLEVEQHKVQQLQQELQQLREGQ